MKKPWVQSPVSQEKKKKERRKKGRGGRARGGEEEEEEITHDVGVHGFTLPLVPLEYMAENISFILLTIR